MTPRKRKGKKNGATYTIRIERSILKSIQSGSARECVTYGNAKRGAGADNMTYASAHILTN